MVAITIRSAELALANGDKAEAAYLLGFLAVADRPAKLWAEAIS